MADAEQRRMMSHPHMDNFDLLTMSYPAPQLPGGMVSNGLDGMNAQGMMPLDNTSNFDAETFAGYVEHDNCNPTMSEQSTDCRFNRSEDLFSNAGMAGQMPQLRRYPSAYEDHFSDVMSAYDQTLQPNQQQIDGNEASIEGGHKLLSFSMPGYSCNILDYLYRRTSLSMTAQLHGMFFLAESPWAAATDATNQPTELTCYRRNLFQISGTLTLPRGWRYIQPETGEQIPIVGQELAVSATESVEGHPVKIISVPWKTPAGNAPVVEDKTEKEPQSIPLDLMAGQEMDETFVTFPISWKRLQFRIATANNGRRKELQQHFIVHVKLLATLTNGAKVPVCEVTSGAIIVRGRSPRNFQSRKDIAISQTGGSIRNRTTPNNANQQAAPPSVASQTGSTKKEPQSAPLNIPPNPFYDGPNMQVSPDFFNWQLPRSDAGGMPHTGAMTAVPPDTPAFNMPAPNLNYARSSPDLARKPPRSTPAAPVHLSLTDDEPMRKPSSPTDSHKPKKQITTPIQRPPSFSLGIMSSPDESAELLYEYFPLTMGDYMPPVDAVYRPHVVHHITVPQDVKTEKTKGKSKRYFSEDQ